MSTRDGTPTRKKPRALVPPSRAGRDEAPAKSVQDFAILGGPTEDGQGAHVLRVREGSISTGEIRPVREGETVTHRELVRLHPIDPERGVCRVETVHAPAALPADATRSRPARVSNERYRKNWDAIFDGPADQADRADQTGAGDQVDPRDKRAHGAKGPRRKRDWAVN